MRRKELEITDFQSLIGVADQCKVCRIAMQDEAGLYVVPMNFGYAVDHGQLVLYFHCAPKGRKLDALRANPDVCVEMDCGHALVEAQAACGYTYAYQSLIGWGRASFLADTEEKQKALSAIMNHQTGGDFTFTEQMVRGVCVFQIALDSLSGKAHS